MVITAMRFEGCRNLDSVAGRRRSSFPGKFTQTKIAPSYGKRGVLRKDAMTGLRLMNELMDPATRETLLRRSTRSPATGVSVTTTVTVKICPR